MRVRKLLKEIEATGRELNLVHWVHDVVKGHSSDRGNQKADDRVLGHGRRHVRPVEGGRRRRREPRGATTKVGPPGNEPTTALPRGWRCLTGDGGAVTRAALPDEESPDVPVLNRKKGYDQADAAIGAFDGMQSVVVQRARDQLEDSVRDIAGVHVAIQ